MGLEPTTFGSTVRCSNQIELRPRNTFQAKNIAIPLLLCQLFLQKLPLSIEISSGAPAEGVEPTAETTANA
jgi:hypothetical protein